jgi:hypothetical protein
MALDHMVPLLGLRLHNEDDPVCCLFVKCIHPSNERHVGIIGVQGTKLLQYRHHRYLNHHMKWIQNERCGGEGPCQAHI